MSEYRTRLFYTHQKQKLRVQNSNGLVFFCNMIFLSKGNLSRSLLRGYLVAVSEAESGKPTPSRGIHGMQALYAGSLV